MTYSLLHRLEDAYHDIWNNYPRDIECPHCTAEQGCGEGGDGCETELFSRERFFDAVDEYLQRDDLSEEVYEYLDKNMNWWDYLTWKSNYEDANN